MKLRRLDYNNFDEIISFNKKNFSADYWKEEIWTELLRDPDCFYYGYTVDGVLIANVFIDENPEGYIKIMNLAVDEKYRGQGLATKILNFVTEKYKDTYKEFFAETRQSNIAMQKAFEKAGYVFRCLEENMYENPRENGYKYKLILAD